MGTSIEAFDVPVCNCFKEKVLYDQLCYEVDLEKFRDPIKLKDQLRIGFTFILDYNKERYLPEDILKKTSNLSLPPKSLATAIIGSEYNNAKIVLNTIGKYCQAPTHLASSFPVQFNLTHLRDE